MNARPYSTPSQHDPVRRTLGAPRNPRRSGSPLPCAALLLVLLCSGCTSVLSPIHGIPARRLPPQFLAPPRADLVQIDLSMLRQDPPDEYLLGPGDILGIFVEGVLGNPEEAPPVHFPEAESPLPPAIGFPIPVREDGTISLPLIPPVLVRGMTTAQAEQAIRAEYTQKRQILQPGRDGIIVTLIKERTHQVIVVREDGGTSQLSVGAGGLVTGSLRKGTGDIVNLPAYQNDILHALAETGGLPGLDAKNEVVVIKSRLANRDQYAALLQEFYACSAGDPCVCPPPPPDGPGVIRIPLRVPPGFIPNLRPQDIILEDGDIVYVEAREAEVFYTAGLLPGGQHPVPRDYDITVLAAMGIAGGGIDQGGGGGGGSVVGGGGIGGLGGAPPTQLYVLRQLPCRQQVTIAVDLVRAVNDPRENILVAPGDTLILRYKTREEVLNFSLATFFTFGIQQLFTSD
ncbi:MAG: polysaccharide biosynthesis/export family protein [Planctomycetes bacterium]|nr:polysaccharide biosynthesis/export family protein [Planctomycetota bacterium]